MRRRPRPPAPPPVTRAALPTFAALDEAFDDIAIVDLDERRTTWSRVHESMRVVYLRLNRAPDLYWIRLFHEEREARVHARRFGLWIEGASLSFDCRVEDIERHHLPDFEASIAYANRRYREVLEAQRARDDSRHGDTRDEGAMLAGLAARLRARANAEADEDAPPAEPIAAAQSLELLPHDRPSEPRSTAHPSEPLPITPALEPLPIAQPFEPLPIASALEPLPIAQRWGGAGEGASAAQTAHRPDEAPAPPPDAPTDEFETRRRALRDAFRSAAHAAAKERNRGQD